MRVKLNSEKDKYIETTDRIEPHGVIRAISKFKGKDPVCYLKQPGFLDTETSHNHDNDYPIGWIYQWCFEFNGQYCIGRYPSELIEQFKTLVEYYELNEKKRLVIYVHNLSYDHVYLYKQLVEEFGEPEILAIKSHKVLTARYGGIEFRCSYLLSNMSLSAWGKKLKCPVRKMDGAIDYETIRYPDEELEQVDWEYMVNDVAALKCCLLYEMIEGNDNIVTIPLTSTGYVRRDCRRAAREEEGFRDWFKKTALTPECYDGLVWAYAGGLTHGNRFLAGKTIDDAGHDDYKSFYPSVDMLRYLPMGQWLHIYSWEETPEPFSSERLSKYLTTKCCLIQVCFNNLRLRKHVTCPCVSKHKIMSAPFCKFTINEAGTVGTDNGRVINASGDVLMWVTELDYYWIIEQYETDGQKILQLFTCDRDYDRDCIRNVTNEYFKIKESLPKDSYFYTKSKNKLNSIYGMKSTSIVRPDVVLDTETGLWTETKDMSEENIEEQLNKYYKSYNSFNNFSHGVYITSWARFLLLKVIRDIYGYDKYIYCDTDSVFYKKDPEIIKRRDAFNKEVIELNKSLGLGVPNRSGGISYIGILDTEADIKRFRFLHAKCYAFETLDGELHCTIAGVTADNKKLPDDAGYITREQELGSIEALEDGFTFKECGGTNSHYEDAPITRAYIDGHDVEYAASCIIRQTTKKLGGTVDGFNIYEVED